MKAAVVVPTNRPERIQQFIAAWAPQFNRPDVSLIVIEDAPEWTFDAPGWVDHYCHKSIVDNLGNKAACIPTRSGGCRDFGFWLAGQDRSIDMIVSLDDDVLPLPDVDFLAEHWQALETPRSLKWWPLFPGFRLRGEPYFDAMVKPVFNLGLWQGFPDVDAYQQLRDPACAEVFANQLQPQASQLLPPGMYAPLCGMNFAVRREQVPFVYFPPLPQGMRRFDDIWMGLMFKRIADLFNWGVTYGSPILRHERASDPMANLKQEMLGYGFNEELWRILDSRPQGTSCTSPLETYKCIASFLGEKFPILRETSQRMQMWVSLWEEET